MELSRRLWDSELKALVRLMGVLALEDGKLSDEEVARIRAFATPLAAAGEHQHRGIRLSQVRSKPRSRGHAPPTIPILETPAMSSVVVSLALPSLSPLLLLPMRSLCAFGPARLHRSPTQAGAGEGAASMLSSNLSQSAIILR